MSGPTSRPTSRPVPKFVTMSHEALLKEVSQRPLVTVELMSSAGKPLSDAEKANLQRADGLLRTSQAARKKGDFKGASESARDATNLYQRIFAAAYFLTVTASTEATTMDQFAGLSPAEKQDLAEADRQEEAAEAATKNGDFFAARKAARQTLDIRERILGKNHVELGDALRLLGNAEIELQSLQNAQELLVRALELIEASYGKNHPKTSLVLDRLGWLRIYQGKYEPAATLLRRAVWILNNAQGESVETAESLDNLGTALTYSRDFEEAVNTKLRSLFIRETFLGPEARETGISLSNLAWFYSRIGKLDEVIPLRKKTLAIFEKELGPDHHDTIIELSNLAQAYSSVGKLSESAELYEQQIARDDKRAGPTEAGAVNRLTMLGSVYMGGHRQADGERVLGRAFEKGRRLYDDGERSAAIAELTRVANLYERHRMLDDAVKIREQVWKWDEAQVTIATAETIQRCTKTARLYLDVGCPKEAKDILTKALGQARTLYGEGELETTGPMIILCSACEKLGEFDEAVKLCEKVLRIIESKLIRESPSGVFASHLLGRIQTRQKHYDVARFSLEEAKEKYEKLARKDGITEIGILRDMATCRLGAGDQDEALKLFREAIDKSRKFSADGGPYMMAELATSIKRLLDASANGLSIDANQRDDLRKELRELLEKLREGKALDADNKKWLEELSSSGAEK